MTIKWSKRLAIEYIRQMKSPIEEQNRSNGNGNRGVSQIFERLKTLASKGKES